MPTLFSSQPALRERLILAGNDACRARESGDGVGYFDAITEIDRITSDLAAHGLCRHHLDDTMLPVLRAAVRAGVAK